MYSLDERMKAVKLYIQYDFSAAAVMRELGYPKSRHSIYAWYNEFQMNEELHTKRIPSSKFTDEQRRTAVNYFLKHGRCVSRTVKKLGYPSRTTLSSWLEEDVPDYANRKGVQSGTSLVQLSQSKKEQAVKDFCLREGSAREVADRYGVSRFSVYNWSWQMLGKGNLPMKKKRSDPDEKTLDELKADNDRLKKENEKLERLNYYLHMENDALQSASELLKKDQGANLINLTNREKAIVIGALRKNYPLKDLLQLFNIAKSSYCYQQAALLAADKYEELRVAIQQVFEESQRRYGYRRIHAVLRNEGILVSEKIVRRLMRESQMRVFKSRKRHYNSYKGEITPAVPNILDRDFHSDRPNEKWVTDITEFSIPAGKVYLSPMIDCFDGLPVSWTIGTSPNAEMVNTMLDKAVSTLGENDHPIVHSDRGCHYRWPGWIDRMNDAGLTRSMSKKGCSPDNSACEGFFGRLKNEMFYGHSWRNTSLERFIQEVDDYMHWYAEDRIKLSLGGMSPLQYRKKMGLAV